MKNFFWILKWQIRLIASILLSKFRNKENVSERIIKEISHVVKGKIIDVKPLGIAKSGNISYKVKLPHRTVKYFTCFSEKDAKAVKEISNLLQKNGILFPEVYSVVGKAVVSEWILGKQLQPIDLLLKPNILDKFVEYQAKIHKVDLKENMVLNFSYVDFLISRFEKETKNISLAKKVNLNLIKKRKQREYLSICHPDFTFSNIVLTSNNELCIIDNETIYFGHDLQYDIMNTKNICFRSNGFLKQKYLSLYKKYNPLFEYSEDDYDVLLWYVRQVGGNLVVGKKKKAMFFLKQAILLSRSKE